MTPTEFAFLALGLVLGVAGGAAIVVVLRSHPSPHEVKITVARDAVPRRAATLSIDAFHSPAEVARGGPADRRSHDRDFPATNDPPRLPDMLNARTSVLATLPTEGGLALPAGIRIAREPDPDLAALRASMAVAADQARLSGTLTATAILQRPPEPPAVDAGTEPMPETATDEEPAIRPILRGDRRALLRVVAALAPADRPVERIRWQRRLTDLVDAIVRAAIDDGMLVLPEGHRFWNPFDRDQTREILRALAAHGHRPDGAGGWQDGRSPTGRRLATVLADAGLDPRRIRHWLIEDRIADLVRHATVAADEYITLVAPNLELLEVQSIVGPRLPGAETRLADLWAAWDRVRELLLLGHSELIRRSSLR